MDSIDIDTDPDRPKIVNSRHKCIDDSAKSNGITWNVTI
jgi:hypothetical protein